VTSILIPWKTEKRQKKASIFAGLVYLAFTLLLHLTGIAG